MRWIFRGIGVVLLAAVAMAAVVFLLPSERVANLAAERISAATGRTVELRGEVRPTIWPHLGVRAEDFVIGNPDWVEDGPLIAAEALSVRVPWWAVLSGRLQIDELALIAPRIALVRASDGRVSWAFDTAAVAAAPIDTRADADAGAERGTLLALDAIEIRDGQLSYEDQGAGQRYVLSDISADIELPASGPASFDVSGVVNGTALSLTAGIADLPRLLDGVLSPAVLALTWSGGSAGFDGRLSLAPSLDGDVTVSATDLGPIAALAGVDLPAIPQGMGRDQIAFEGHVTLATEGTAHIRDGQLTLDDNSLALALDITPGAERPTLRGTVEAARLRLPSTGAGTGGGSGAPAAAATGWPRDRIDVSGLFAADAELALAVGQVDMDGWSIGPVQTRASLTRGRVVFDIDRVDLFDGRLAGQFVVNGRGGMSVGGDLRLEDLALRPALVQFADFDRLSGTGAARLQFLGIGNDIDTVMRSLSGSGSVSFGAGAIDGLDIAGMIRNLDTSFRGEGARTVYDSVTASFAIDAGVLRNDDLRLDAGWGEVTGAGTVNLGAQTLDYRVIPGVMRDDAGATSIRVPVLVQGPWASPTIRPDLEYLAEQNLAEQRERLEAEARTRLDAEANRLEAEARARANELLGLDLEEGDSTEDAQDALEQRLVNEAEDQLRRLLGRD